MKLEEIRDIIRLLGQYSSRKRKYLDISKQKKKDSKITDFLKILTDTRIRDDDEASEIIYQKKAGNNYRFLKNHVTSLALEALEHFDLDREDVSGYSRASYRTYKNLLHSIALVRFGRMYAGASVARSALRLAEKYEFFHAAVELLEQLRNVALNSGRKKEFERYTALLEKNLRLLASESRMRTIEQRLVLPTTRSIYIDEELQETVRASFNAAQKELEENKTYRNQLSFYRISYIHYQYAGSPKESRAACDEAIQFLNRAEHLTVKGYIGEFNAYKIENCLFLLDYISGRETASECSIYYTEGTNPWFNYKEQFFLLSLQTGNYEEARKIFTEATTHKRFLSEPMQIEERWNIFRLYIDYINFRESRLKGEIKRLTLLRRKKFKKYLKEYPVYSKDKRGMNAALLILNILLLLESGKNEEVTQQIEGLETYRAVHLQGKNAYETAILFKLIKLMDRYDFDLSKIGKHSAKFEAQLAVRNPSIGELKECVQILPPVVMWGWMKEAMKANKF